MHDEPDPVRTLTYDAVRGASAEAVRGNVSKIAFVSFLFNWPSSGGGNCHTAELGRLFKTYGYEVRHIFVRYEPWKIGDVAGPPPLDSMVLEFDEAGWQTENIQHRYRAALQEFDPDVVFVTDAWNFKPQLAEAAQEYPYFLRFDAQECLCPLNNIRLLPIGNGLLRQCHRHQFATYQACTECVGRFGSMMGDLHRKERALSGVGSEKYHVRLVASVSNAKAVLVVNPLIATMLEPYADYTLVIPPGVDAAEFSPSYCPRTHVGPIRILFAGIASDVLKGFHVLRNACNQLWQHRHDFELHVTSSPFGGSAPFMRFVGFQSRAQLHAQMERADLFVIPSLCQESGPIVGIEAMAAGCPVIGSRIGGISFVVTDDFTGLLFEPGDSNDLATKLNTLLDSATMREGMGRAGRRRFEKLFTWKIIIEKHYLPLLNSLGPKNK